MTILAAIRREERKLEKQLGKLNHQLSGVRAAAKALGGSANRELTGVKKRVDVSWPFVDAANLVLSTVPHTVAVSPMCSFA